MDDDSKQLSINGKCCCLLVFVIVALDIGWRFIKHRFSGFPSPPTIPYVGNLHLLVGRNQVRVAQLFLKWHEEYENCFVLWLGWRPLVVTSNPEHAEIILKNSLVSKKSNEYKYFKPLIGTGLLLSEGELWKQRRKLLTPAFHLSVLVGFGEVFRETAEKLVSNLKPLANTGKVFNICPFVTKATLDALSKAAMGVDINVQEAETNVYGEALIRISRLIFLRQVVPLFWLDTLFNLTSYGWEWEKCLKVLHSYPERIIKQRIQEHSLSGYKRSTCKAAFLDILLDAYFKGDIDEEGLRSEVNTFMIEGHDTTAHAISWTLYLLGAYPDVQEMTWKCIEAGLQTQNQDIVEAVKNASYLESVIKESLRLFSPVPLFARELVQDVVLGNQKLCKGCTVVICPGPLHRSKSLWGGDSLEFNPDRFSTGLTNKHPYAYIPFSAGPRNCIGQKFAVLEMKIVVGVLLKSFKISCLQSPEECGPYGDQVLRPYYGINLMLSARF